MADLPCPICRRNAAIYDYPTKIDTSFVKCDRCGQFLMSGLLTSTLQAPDVTMTKEDQSLLPYLSAYTRQISEAGSVPLLISENWREFATTRTSTAVSLKVNKLLHLATTRSKNPGDIVEFSAALDSPLLSIASENEFIFLLRHLGALEYLSIPVESQPTRCIVTIRGWEQEEASQRERGIRGRCFVAMWFDATTEDTWSNGIELGVRDCGCDPIRIDKVHHNEKICDRILGEIRLAQFSIADFTGHRGGGVF